MKFLSNVMTVICVVMMIWFGMSYTEIIFKNGSPNPEYSNYNIIVTGTEWAIDYFGYDF